MAKKLSLQIKLEGGKEIKRELAEMGEEGKRAFYEIGKAAKQVGGFDNLDPKKLAQVNAELKKAGVAAAELDKVADAVNRASRTQRLVSTVKAVESGFENLTSTVKLAALAFGPMGIAIGYVAEKAIAMVGALTGGSEAINQMSEAAAKAGLNIKKYDQLRASLEKGGVSGGGIAEALQKITEAGEKSKLDQVTKAVKELQKVIARGSNPRTSPALEQLLSMAQGYGDVADAARKAIDDLDISFSDDEKRLQARASSSVRSLSQLASAVTVEGRAFASGLQELAAGTDTTAGLLRAFIQQLEGISDPAERNAYAFREMGAAGLELAKGVQTGAISSKQSVDQITASVKTLDQAQLDSASRMQQSYNAMTTAFERFRTTGDFSQLGVAFREIGNQMSIGFGMAAQNLSPLISKIQELSSSVTGAVWDTFSSAGQSAIAAVSSSLDGLIAKLREAVRLVGSMPGGGIPSAVPPGYARGGMIGGYGTGTSDSNLALVSRGEHIMPARAVAQPGVLALLEALRRSGGNLSQVLNGLGRYATGGLVMPSLAGASIGGGMSNVTIQFPGLPSIGGLRASSGVVEELQRAAAMAQVRSGGRKPSRYRWMIARATS